MDALIRKTKPSDLEHLSAVERSAGTAFKSLPSFAWIDHERVMSAQEHKRFLTNGLSWVALDSLTQAVCGFIHTEVIECDLYIGEISVAEAYQKNGIGSKLLRTALEHAKSLGLSEATLTTFIDVPWNAPYYQKQGFVILTAGNLPPYLKQKLQEEESVGLAPARRCAMRKPL